MSVPSVPSKVYNQQNMTIAHLRDLLIFLKSLPKACDIENLGHKKG